MSQHDSLDLIDVLHKDTKLLWGDHIISNSEKLKIIGVISILLAQDSEALLNAQSMTGHDSSRKITDVQKSFNVKEAAEFIGVSNTTIYSMAKKNEIPHKKVRGRIIFRREVLEEWLSNG